MACGDTITWDTLLRSALRTDGGGPSGCLALAFNTQAISDNAFGCEGPTALTRYAMAVLSGVVQVQPLDGDTPSGITCDQAEIGVEELVSELVATGATLDAVVNVWVADLNATHVCESDCDDAHRPLLELIRGTIVTVGGVRYWRVIIADETPAEALGCDFDGIGMETLLRMTIAKVGENEYAWRYVDES